MAEAYGVKPYDIIIGIGCHDSLLIQIPPVYCKLPHVSLTLPYGVGIGALPTLTKEQADQFNGPNEAEYEAKTLKLTEEKKDENGELSDEAKQEIKDLTADLRKIPYTVDGTIVMGRTSDAGIIVPHISIPLNNALIPLTILFGSSVQVLGARSHRVHCKNLIYGHTTTDIATLLPGLLPIGLNLACNDPLPVCGIDVVITTGTTACYNVDWSDVWNATCDVFQECLIAGVMAAGGKGLGKITKRFKVKPSRILKKKSPIKYLNKADRELAKVGDVSGRARKVARQISGGKEPKFEIRLGGTNKLKLGSREVSGQFSKWFKGRGHAFKVNWRGARLMKEYAKSPRKPDKWLSKDVDRSLENVRRSLAGERLVESRNPASSARRSGARRRHHRAGTNLTTRSRRHGNAQRRRTQPIREQTDQLRMARDIQPIRRQRRRVTRRQNQSPDVGQQAERRRQLLNEFDKGLEAYKKEQARHPLSQLAREAFWEHRYSFLPDVGIAYGLGYMKFHHTAGDFEVIYDDEANEPDEAILAKARARAEEHNH